MIVCNHVVISVERQVEWTEGDIGGERGEAVVRALPVAVREPHERLLPVAPGGLALQQHPTIVNTSHLTDT